MDFFTFAALYLAATAVLLFVLLFGDNPLFEGTPVAGLKWVISSGVWEGLEWLVWKCCGDRGVNAVEAATEYCCDRPNPTLQIFYVVLISSGYFTYWEAVFKLLPDSPFASEYHQWTGTAAACLCLALFIAASLSDPGTITADNVEQHHALYSADGRLWQEGVECWTCHFVRPARSKHCGVCGRCVARFDHHCGWINNCVGLNNIALFSSFLLANCAMCVYGSTLGGLVLWGELERHGMLQVSSWHPGLGRMVPLRHQPRVLARWLLRYYPAACMLLLFLLVASLIILAFFGYHVHLLLRGVTMYETFRQQRLEQEQRQHARVAQQAVQHARGLAGDVRPASWRQRLCCMFSSKQSGGGGDGGSTATGQAAGIAAGTTDGAAECAGPAELAGPAEIAGPPERAGPAERAGSAERAGPAEHVGPAERAGDSGKCGGQACSHVNLYDRGMVQNLYEVLRPHRVLQEAWAVALQRDKMQ